MAEEPEVKGGDTPPEPTPDPTKGAGDTPASPEAEAEKWKALSRKHEAQAKANAEAAKRLAEIEDSNKSEIEKATTKATEAEKKAAAAELNALRMEVALDKAPEGMTVAQIRKLAKRLVGVNREELEEDAADLFEDYASSEGDDTPPAATGGRPKEKLRPGASNSKDPEPDPDKLADEILSRGF